MPLLILTDIWFILYEIKKFVVMAISCILLLPSVKGLITNWEAEYATVCKNLFVFKAYKASLTIYVTV